MSTLIDDQPASEAPATVQLTYREAINAALHDALAGDPAVLLLGEDVDAVHAAVSESVERARAGGGPSLLEMKTYRYRGHSRSDPAKYRPAGELDAWLARDPIEILGGRLAAEGVLSADDQATRRTGIQAEIDAAAELAAAAPYPTLEDTRSYVYAD